jgi:hypothetical protein
MRKGAQELERKPGNAVPATVRPVSWRQGLPPLQSLLEIPREASRPRGRRAQTAGTSQAEYMTVQANTVLASRERPIRESPIGKDFIAGHLTPTEPLPHALWRPIISGIVASDPGIQEEAMCDYSLEVYGTQPAREGEKYVTSRFPSGTVGLAKAGGGTTAICVQCDTQLCLDNIPQDLQVAYDVGPQEKVTFVRLENGPFRDGVRFRNGREMPRRRALHLRCSPFCAVAWHRAGFRSYWRWRSRRRGGNRASRCRSDG